MGCKSSKLLSCFSFRTTRKSESPGDNNQKTSDSPDASAAVHDSSPSGPDSSSSEPDSSSSGPDSSSSGSDSSSSGPDSSSSGQDPSSLGSQSSSSFASGSSSSFRPGSSCSSGPVYASVGPDSSSSEQRIANSEPLSNFSSTSVEVSGMDSDRSPSDIEPRFGRQSSVGDQPVEGRPLPPPGRNTATVPSVLVFNADLPGAANLEPPAAARPDIQQHTASAEPKGSRKPRPKAAKGQRTPFNASLSQPHASSNAVRISSTPCYVADESQHPTTSSDRNNRPRPAAVRGERPVSDNVYEVSLPGYIPENSSNNTARSIEDFNYRHTDEEDEEEETGGAEW